MRRTVEIYNPSEGDPPFTKWYKSLKDSKTRTRIFERIKRVGLGNFGDYKPLGDEVYELKCQFGGGNKSTQTKDIKKSERILE